MTVALVAAVTLFVPAATAGGAEGATTARPTPSALIAKPAKVDFKHKRVGTENYKGTKITNTSGSAVLLVVTAGLPDDFGFGLMPGQTCPVFAPGEILAAGASCEAVVRFSPSAGFIDWLATGSLQATAADPATGATLQVLGIPVLGMAVA
jgi:hypothetical protein